MLTPLINLLTHLTHLIAPPTCLTCSTLLPPSQPISLCPDCVQRCLKWTHTLLPPTEAPPMTNMSRANYHGPLNEHITLAKRGDIALMWSLSYLLADITQQDITQRIGWSPDLLIPLPARLPRLARRGASLPHLIAAQIAERTNIKATPEALKRAHPTPPQSTLKREARLTAQHGSLIAHNINDLSILIIDDVYTTGATLREAQRACLAAGAARVASLSLMSAGDIEERSTYPSKSNEI